jgi:hypothetical protein
MTMTATRTGDTEGAVRTGVWSILAIGAALGLGALVLSGWRAALSLAAGAGLGAGNLWALGRIVCGLLEPNRAKGPWIVVGVTKWVGVLGILYMLIRTGFADLLPLALGLATLPLGIVLAQLVSPRRPRGPS